VKAAVMPLKRQQHYLISNLLRQSNNLLEGKRLRLQFANLLTSPAKG
jgi:hypothetical protein